MRPIFGEKSTMRCVGELSRSAAEVLVDREERRTGSRMLAYASVAATIGTTADWVRKFVGTTEAKEPKLSVGFKILQIYSRVCERVERAGENEVKLKGEIDAALESAGLLVAREARSETIASEIEGVSK